MLLEQRPDVVIVYGDTNSTLAGALAAAKLDLPVAHVEAGLRSFDRSMPEEINRVVTDHVSATSSAPPPRRRLPGARGHRRERVYRVGDLMYDSLLAALPLARRREGAVLAKHGLSPGGYYLATVHRPANTDDPASLRRSFEAFWAAGRAGGAAAAPADAGGRARCRDLARRQRASVVEPGGLPRDGGAGSQRPGGRSPTPAASSARLTSSACPVLRFEKSRSGRRRWRAAGTCSPGQTRPLSSQRRQRPDPQTPPPPVFGDGQAAAKIVEILERDPPHR